MTGAPLPKEILALDRPHPALWRYYILSAVLTGPFVFFTLIYLFFRYHTLRYRFDEEGIHMRVGILFREEVNLTYARIQDIHLRSNVIQRWLGLANVQIQTASGSSTAEVVIEGFKEFNIIRDFLYTRMRGYREQERFGPGQAASKTAAGPSETAPAGSEEMMHLLLGIRDELRQTRELLEQGAARSTSAPTPIPPGTGAPAVSSTDHV